MFTSSLACTSSPARLAITSLAFMFELVPEPVWKTSIGNWSSSSPAAIRSPAAAMRSALSASSSPSSAFTRAAAALILPSQRATGAGIGSPETGKLPTALVVLPPQSCVRSSVLATQRDYLGGRLQPVAGAVLNRAQAAAHVDRPLPQQATCVFGELRARCPADVVALRAIVECRAALVVPDGAPVATAQTLDLAKTNLHAENIGLRGPPTTLERGM